MLLTTGQRGQTLIACRVDHMDLRVSRAVLLLSTTLKTSKPTFHQAPLEIKAFPDDRRICPFTYLKEYLRRTVKLRQTKQFFIKLRQPHTAISRDTLRRWTRETLSAAGIDMDRYLTLRDPPLPDGPRIGVSQTNNGASRSSFHETSRKCNTLRVTERPTLPHTWGLPQSDPDAWRSRFAACL